MTRIKLDNDMITYINLFERVTRARVKDCISNGDRITFVVMEGDAGMAIGKKGANVKNLKKKINKDIEIIEHSKNPSKFIKNLFKPVEVMNTDIVEINGETIFQATIQKNRILARAKMKKAKELMIKYYKFSDIIFY